MLILGQKPCFLAPTIFEIPGPNWYYSTCKPPLYYLLILHIAVLLKRGIWLISFEWSYLFWEFYLLIAKSCEQCSGICKCHTLKNMLFHRKMFWYYEIISCSDIKATPSNLNDCYHDLTFWAQCCTTNGIQIFFLWKFYAVTNNFGDFWPKSKFFWAKISIWLAVQQLVCSKSEIMQCVWNS